MPTKEIEEAFRDASKAATWWRDKLGVAIPHLRSAYDEAYPKELRSEDPFEPDPKLDNATPEQLAIIENLQKKQEQLDSVKKRLDAWDEQDPLGERVDAREQLLSTNPLIQKLREHYPNMPGFLREQELENNRINEIGQLEDDVMDGTQNLPHPLYRPHEKLHHAIEEITGWDWGLHGKDGERYPQEYMREKAEIYQDATNEYEKMARDARMEYYNLRREHYLLESTHGTEPSIRQGVEASQKAADDTKKLNDEFKDLLRGEKKALEEQEERNKKNPPKIWFMAEPGTVKLDPKEVDRGEAYASSPAATPQLSGPKGRTVV